MRSGGGPLLFEHGTQWGIPKDPSISRFRPPRTRSRPPRTKCKFASASFTNLTYIKIATNGSTRCKGTKVHAILGGGVWWGRAHDLRAPGS